MNSINILGMTTFCIVYEKNNIIIQSSFYRNFQTLDYSLIHPSFVNKEEKDYIINYILQNKPDYIDFDENMIATIVQGNDYKELQKHIPNNKIMLVFGRYAPIPTQMAILGELSKEEETTLTLIGNFEVNKIDVYEHVMF